jgi:hypothetical protein
MIHILLQPLQINDHLNAASRKVSDSIPDEVFGFFNSSSPFSRNIAPRWTQPLTEMSTRIFLGVKVRSTRKADNLIDICHPMV